MVAHSLQSTSCLYFAVWVETSAYGHPATIGRAIVAIANGIECVKWPAHAVAMVINKLSVASWLTATVGRDLLSNAIFIL